MEELIESIEKNGLLHPLVVWEQNDGNYLILSGHNRKEAFQILYDSTKDEQYSKVFCYIKKCNEITEDEAKEIIIDTNWVQRELSTIEKAQSIYRKYTAIGRKQKVKDGEGQGIRNYDIIAEQYNISGRHVLNYYKLNILLMKLKIWFLKID
jgi:ParB family chromosome partitioning protein